MPTIEKTDRKVHEFFDKYHIVIGVVFVVVVWGFALYVQFL